MAPQAYDSRFLRWVWRPTPLLLAAMGGIWLLLRASTDGSPLGWAGLAAQWVGGACLLAVALGTTREAGDSRLRPRAPPDAAKARGGGPIHRQLVELMGGRIWVDSAPGRGSSFYFTVRLALSDRAPAPTPGLSNAGLDAAALAGLRGADILLVEDVELNQDVIRHLLERAGLRVRLAANGAEAIRAVEESRPDCVLMDCLMPVMDGFEATRRLRAQARYRDLPIVALTANATAGDREHCLAAGMNGFVTKPVDLDELYAAIAQWVRPRPAADPAGSVAPPAATRPDGPALPRLAGIDTASGLALTGGGQPFYCALLTSLRDDRANGFLERFRQARRAADWPAATALAHNLKGLARTLGAGLLGDLAERLEQAARAGQPEAIDGRLAPLEAELELVLAGLDRLDRPAPVPDPDPEPRHSVFHRLDRLLAEDDTAAVVWAARLEQAMAGSEYAATASAIGRVVARYDFAEARAELHRLARSLDLPGDWDDPERSA